MKSFLTRATHWVGWLRQEWVIFLILGGAAFIVAPLVVWCLGKNMGNLIALAMTANVGSVATLRPSRQGPPLL